MRTSLAMIAVVLLAGAAHGESATPAPPETLRDCTPVSPEPGENPDKPLGDKLAEGKGVLCPPPSMDSDIRKRPPDSGAKTPVIEPPPAAR